ncbi:hypothetical protein VNO78_30665 [Psophocarpus tetragonolobus]|uniref:Uncharacterized protein n=1 Tax=Psophocarpus tetragonolobus TaxID=3891 RepID=A0AAN9RX77_PSOTE
MRSCNRQMSVSLAFVSWKRIEKGPNTYGYGENRLEPNSYTGLPEFVEFYATYKKQGGVEQFEKDSLRVSTTKEGKLTCTLSCGRGFTSKIKYLRRQRSLQGLEDTQRPFSKEGYYLTQKIFSSQDSADSNKFFEGVHEEVCSSKIKETKATSIPQWFVSEIWGGDGYDWMSLNAEGRPERLLIIWRKSLFLFKFHFHEKGKKGKMWSDILMTKRGLPFSIWGLVGNFNSMCSGAKAIKMAIKSWSKEVYGHINVGVQEKVDDLLDLD